MPDILLNGQQVPHDKALIPVSDRGFRFGDGVFETIRVHDGVPYRFDWHMARLARGLDGIKLDYNIEPLQGQCATLLKYNGIKNGLLRIQITRGSSGTGYLPKNGNPTVLIETLPLTERPEGDISLWLSDYRRIPDNALPVQSKLCQGMNSTLARMQAQQHGCFEALQLNQQQLICEASSSNIFWEKQGALFTPALDCGVLAGATRSILCELAAPAHTIHARLKELELADAVCITNASWGVLPVSSLEPEGYRWLSNGLAHKLNDMLAKHMASHSKEHKNNW